MRLTAGRNLKVNEAEERQMKNGMNDELFVEFLVTRESLMGQ
jgi:hypothetical protein